MPKYLTNQPWFYGNQYYAADVLNPFVFTHDGEPGFNWYPLDKDAEIALQKQYDRVKGVGVMITPPHKIPDVKGVKLPDPIHVPTVVPFVGDPGPFLVNRGPQFDQTTMSGQQTTRRPSDTEPTQIKK